MRQGVSVLLIGLILVGCGSPAAPAPVPQTLNQPPANVKLSGTVLGPGLRVGDYAVWLTSAAEPARGTAQLEAVVLDKNDQPVNDATVAFDIDMTNMSHGKNITPAASQGDGHYAGEVHFMMGGPWRVIVVIERSSQAPVSARFNFNVK